MIRKPTLLDLLHVVAHARDDERAEYEAVRGMPWDSGKVAAEFHSRTDAASMCLYAGDGTPVAVAGFLVDETGVHKGWMFSTDAAWRDHWRTLTKAVRRTMASMLANGVRVIEFRTTTNRTHAMHWYSKGLRMRYEGTLRARCANGQDVAVYSLVGGSV